MTTLKLAWTTRDGMRYVVHAGLHLRMRDLPGTNGELWIVGRQTAPHWYDMVATGATPQIAEARALAALGA